jgi:RNA recognition motif-containing protein
MSDEARQKATIYVGGLSPEVNANVLHDAFYPFGDIADISLPKPELKSNTDPHRGFGYIEFESPDDAKEAIDNMDQSELFGRVIKVTQAKPKKSATEGLGSKVAVWEQVGVLRTRRDITAALLIVQQEGYAAKYHVNEEDRMTADQTKAGASEEQDVRMDPMQGLEGLDVAGPRPE